MKKKLKQGNEMKKEKRERERMPFELNLDILSVGVVAGDNSQPI